MSGIFVIASNTFRQTVRQRLFYNIAFFGLGMVLFAMVVGNLTFGYPDRVVRSIGLSGVSMALDLMALLLGVTLIYEEIDRKTLFVVLARPIRRSSYVVGRYFGLALALLVSHLGLSIVFLVALMAAKGTVSAGDLIALAASYPEALLLAGVGLVLSSFSTPTISAGTGIGIWLAAASTDDLVRLTKDDPLQSGLAKVVYYVLPSLERFNFRDVAVHQLPIDPAELATTFAYAVLYGAMLVVIAGLILNRREMT